MISSFTVIELIEAGGIIAQVDVRPTRWGLAQVLHDSKYSKQAKQSNNPALFPAREGGPGQLAGMSWSRSRELVQRTAVDGAGHDG
jgi:hypothetical protein